MFDFLDFYVFEELIDIHNYLLTGDVHQHKRGSYFTAVMLVCVCVLGVNVHVRVAEMVHTYVSKALYAPVADPGLMKNFP